jgi:hypothetical protein
MGRNVEASQRHIEFDRNGTPCGDNASKFTSFISIITRDRVSCTLKEWRDIKEYDPDLKDKIWTEINVIIKSLNMHIDNLIFYVFLIINYHFQEFWKRAKSLSRRMQQERSSLGSYIIKPYTLFFKS